MIRQSGRLRDIYEIFISTTFLRTIFSSLNSEKSAFVLIISKIIWKIIFLIKKPSKNSIMHTFYKYRTTNFFIEISGTIKIHNISHIRCTIFKRATFCVIRLEQINTEHIQHSTQRIIFNQALYTNETHTTLFPINSNLHINLYRTKTDIIPKLIRRD